MKSIWLRMQGHSIRKSSIIHVEWYTYTEQQGYNTKRKGGCIVYLCDGSAISVMESQAIDALEEIVQEVENNAQR